ncbi:MAG TPA: BTAD domain-containing putative transcriptional regulator [Gemmatimonadaceae bacterium]|nr:BTAD domain-containing putative transcriptional regulator [Gemmatimonadaceae bacterium]
MYRLRLLGGIGLVDNEGNDIEALLRQPKHFALLAYLSLPSPGTWHRRDSVLGTFWPEHEQSRARSALRSALYILRGHLPNGAIRARGDDELSLAPDVIATDVSEMNEAFAQGRFADTLSHFKGELLPGVFITDSEHFEKWLEQERAHVIATAQKAATQLSIVEEQSGKLTLAIDAARRAAELAPDDEAAARRWIALLDRAGDRAQAFAVYERFRNHMSEAFGVRPSAETVALLDAVRTRREPTNTDSTVTVNETPPSVAQAHKAAPTRRSRARWLLLAAPAAIAAFVWLPGKPERDAVAKETTRTLVVLPMTNETGDPRLAYVATGVAEGIASRLEGIGGMRIRSGARSNWSSTVQSVPAVGRQFGATMLLKSRIQKSGDSLEVQAWLVEGSASEERPVARHKFSLNQLRDAESRLTAKIAGAIFRVPNPALPRDLAAPIDPESYRLTLEGWHQIFLRSAEPGSPMTARRIAAALFTRAIDIDSRNARAWSGLSTIWASQVVIDAIPHEEGYARAVAAATRALSIDSLQGTALANLAIMRAFEQKSLAPAIPLLRKAEAAEPSNPEVYLIKSLIMRSAHRYDDARDASRVARQLDPLSIYFANGEGGVEFCAGRPRAALEFAQSELAMNSSNHLAQARLTRSLAMLGRFDEAIASWRKTAALSGDTALANSLLNAKGREGYWSVHHADGRRRLAALEKRGGRISPFTRAKAHFAAGDSARGFVYLEQARQEGIPTLYRLSCMEEFDEFRNTPQFAKALARIGALRSN